MKWKRRERRRSRKKKDLLKEEALVGAAYMPSIDKPISRRMGLAEVIHKLSKRRSRMRRRRMRRRRMRRRRMRRSGMRRSGMRRSQEKNEKKKVEPIEVSAKNDFRILIGPQNLRHSLHVGSQDLELHQTHLQ